MKYGGGEGAFLGDDAERARILEVNRAIRGCPHRSPSSCAGRARCALGKGRLGRVERRDCEACVAGALADAPAPREMPPPGDIPAAPMPAGALPDGPVIFDADDRPARLEGTRMGRAVTLFCGGPSLASVDLRPFFEPWADRAAVNNAGALVRPHWWFSVDTPRHFHQSIWEDPAVAKFVTRNHRQTRTRRREGGAFVGDGPPAAACPSTYFYRRHNSFDHGSWLSEETLSWGCDRARTCSLGLRGASSVMFVALKLLLVLGYRTIVLVGCDWRMDEGPGGQYGFAQAKDAAACRSNNGSYAVNGRRLAALAPIVASIGGRVLNANPDSHLHAFEKVPLGDALAAIEAANRDDPDLEGWYNS